MEIKAADYDKGDYFMVRIHLLSAAVKMTWQNIFKNSSKDKLRGYTLKVGAIALAFFI